MPASRSGLAAGSSTVPSSPAADSTGDCPAVTLAMSPPKTADAPSDNESEIEAFPLLVVAGLSGAGKSTVLHVFEDLRMVTADGVPPSLLPDMVTLLRESSRTRFQGMAFGLDQRRGEFSEEMHEAFERLSARGLRPQLIFLEADPGVLMRRYATTRRPHPLERDGVGLEQAVKEEMEQLAPVRESADLLFDTSSYSIHDLRRVIQRRWKSSRERLRAIKVNLVSFGFKYGVPREADLVFDLRFLPNPYFVEKLRPLTGKDKAVASHVFGEPSGKVFRKRLIDFLTFLLPLYDVEGRYRLTIAIGCTGGRHRSVAMTEALAKALTRQDYAVSVEHRHMELG